MCYDYYSFYVDCTLFSPPATTILIIFLLFEGLLFSIFTGVMFGTQMSAICSDETVSRFYNKCKIINALEICVKITYACTDVLRIDLCIDLYSVN